MAFSRKQGNRLKFESLEQRQMMAGDVSVKLIENNLFIQGDYLANSITIAPGVSAGQVVVSGLTAGGAATSINGTPNGTTTVSGFTRDLRISMLGSDDTVAISDLTIRGNAVIRMGEGDDTLTISDVVAKGNVRVNLGGGADTLALTDTTVAGTTKLMAGKGNDNLTVDTVATKRFDTRLENGNDMLTISDVTAATTHIDGGLGTNTLMDDFTSNLYNPLVRRIT